MWIQNDSDHARAFPIDDAQSDRRENKWKGQKAREMGEGYKLYYSGVENKKNGYCTELGDERGEFAGNRESDCVICLRVVVEKLIVNVICAYAHRWVVRNMKRMSFGNCLDELRYTFRKRRRLGEELNGQAGEGNRETDVIEGHGIGRRNNPKGNRIVDFAVANQLAVLNTSYRKRHSQLITYSNGGRESQIDFIKSRRRGLKRVQDCRVLPMEAVAKQHKLVMCKAVLETKGKQRLVKIRKTRWWKLNEEEPREQFTKKVGDQMAERLRQFLGRLSTQQ
ncbi:uncharacterized protein LOC122245693 [Penaeus japonicus]|uniref:uncharacterized protein LOC122245693 n=1 Tax=Penaeus japonicus TaxID=27405 RepID=UPI001C70E77E|nr:uncharacterized protein LOC122245693 [Penaeus japonicus]